jgi:hypothetical protein
MSASVYECVRLTWPKNRLLGQVRQKPDAGLSTKL